MEMIRSNKETLKIKGMNYYKHTKGDSLNVTRNPEDK